MKVGAIDVVPVHDGVARMSPSAAFAAQAGKGGEDEDWLPHRGLLDEQGLLELALGGFLVRTGDRLALVDLGVGLIRDPTFDGGRLLDSLKALGLAPADITDVLFTHLHFDHVGWATTKGAIVFPNAVYRCDRRDWEHFVTGPDGGAARKLTPVEDRMEMWDSSGTVLPGVDAMVAPGHTPGSTIVVLSSGTDRAMLLGDVVHCPVELLDDEWGSMGDVDPDLARRTRVSLARELEGTDTPVAASHFPGMQFGRLLRGQGKRRWVV